MVVKKLFGLNNIVQHNSVYVSMKETLLNMTSHTDNGLLWYLHTVVQYCILTTSTSIKELDIIKMLTVKKKGFINRNYIMCYKSFENGEKIVMPT